MRFSPCRSILVLALGAIEVLATGGVPAPAPAAAPAPAPPDRIVLKQATRDQIIASYNRPLLSVSRKRATPSSAPPPLSITSADLVYSLYFSGSGVIENDNSPGNNVASRKPVTMTFPGDSAQNTAIQRCADQSQSLPPVYFQFQIYLDSDRPASGDGDGVGVWVCTSYYNGNDDPGYFNVQRASASPVYGYSKGN